MSRTMTIGGKRGRSRKMNKYKWSKYAPGTHQRTVMMKKCGTKCFLGPHKSFPICRKGTCKRNHAGIHAAYVRAREMTERTKKSKYRKIASRAKRMLRRH